MRRPSWVAGSPSHSVISSPNATSILSHLKQNPSSAGGEAGKLGALPPAGESKVSAAFHELADKMKSAMSV